MTPDIPIMPPDNVFAAAVVDAYIRAHFVTAPDLASGLWSVLSEGDPTPAEEEVHVPFGCVRYQPGNRNPKIVPQIYINGRKTSLGHFPYTAAGAEQAAEARQAAVAVKDAGGDALAIRAAARAVQGVGE